MQFIYKIEHWGVFGEYSLTGRIIRRSGHRLDLALPTKPLTPEQVRQEICVRITSQADTVTTTGNADHDWLEKVPQAQRR